MTKLIHPRLPDDPVVRVRVQDAYTAAADHMDQAMFNLLLTMPQTNHYVRIATACILTELSDVSEQFMRQYHALRRLQRQFHELAAGIEVPAANPINSNRINRDLPTDASVSSSHTRTEKGTDQ